MAGPQKRLTDVLLETGLFNAAQLEAAQKNARGRTLLEVLIEESDVVEDRLVRALSAALGVEVVTPAAMKIHDRVLSLIPADLARAHLVLPIAIKRSGEVDYLYLAMADPLDQVAVSKITEASGCQLSILLAPPSQLREAIGHHYEGKGVVRSPSAVSRTPAGPPPLPSKQDSRQNGGPATAPSRVVTGTAESGAAIPRALSNVAAAHENVEHWEVQQQDSAPAAIHLYDHHTGDIMGSAPEGQSSAEGIEDLQNDLRNAILRSGEHEMPVIAPAIPPMPPPETTSLSGPGPLVPPSLPNKPKTPPPEAETELSSRALPSDALVPIEEPEEPPAPASTELDVAASPDPEPDVAASSEFDALVAPVVDESAPPPALSPDALVPEPPLAPRKKLGAPRLPEGQTEADLAPSSISEGDLNAATVLDTPMFSAGLLGEEESVPEIQMLDPDETTAEELESGAVEDVQETEDDEPLEVIDPAAPRLELSDALDTLDAGDEHAPFEVPVAPLAPGPSPFDALRNVRHTPGLERTGIIPVIDWDKEEFVPPEPRSDSQGKGYPGKNDIPESPEQARARAIPKGEAPPPPIPEAKPDSPIQKPTPPPRVEAADLETAPPEPAARVAEPASLDLPPAPPPAAAAIAPPPAAPVSTPPAASSAPPPAAPPSPAPDPDEVPTPQPTEVPGPRLSDFPAAGIEELPTPEPSSLPQADTEAALSQSAQLPHSQTGEELSLTSTLDGLEEQSPSTSIGPPPSAPARPKIRAEASAFEPKSRRVSPGSERKTVPPAPSEAPPEQPFASLLKPEEQTDRGRIPSVPVPKPKVLEPEAPTNPRLDASANDLVGRLLEGASLNSAERAQLVLAIGRVLVNKGVISADDLVDALGTSD